MKKPLIACLVLLALCVSLGTLLAACGKDGEPPAASSAGAESGQPEPAASSAGPESGQPEPAVSSAGPESGQPEPAVSSAGPESGAPEESSQEQSGYAASAEEIEAFAHTWVYTERSAEEEKVCRIILGKDGGAQLVVQDGIGNLIDLSVGSWSLRGAALLELELTTTMSGGEELAESEVFTIGGVYSAAFEQFNAGISLGVTGEASPLTPAQEGGAVVFCDERYTPETIEQLCRCVLNYYAAQNGEAYPGKAVVDEIGEDGVLIRLVEDKGDHTAAAGAYLIDPFTFMGTDEISGGTIDFSDYGD